MGGHAQLIVFFSDQDTRQTNTLTWVLHFQETTDETMRDIYEKLFDKNMPSTVLEGFNNLCSRRNYAFMATHFSSLQLLGVLNCSVMPLKEASLPESLSMAFTKRSPYLGLINFK
jgi:hypothetical protein